MKKHSFLLYALTCTLIIANTAYCSQRNEPSYGKAAKHIGLGLGLLSLSGLSALSQYQYTNMANAVRAEVNLKDGAFCRSIFSKALTNSNFDGSLVGYTDLLQTTQTIAVAGLGLHQLSRGIGVIQEMWSADANNHQNNE
jgi:hypothetical protein